MKFLAQLGRFFDFLNIVMVVVSAILLVGLTLIVPTAAFFFLLLIHVHGRFSLSGALSSHAPPEQSLIPLPHRSASMVSQLQKALFCT